MLEMLEHNEHAEHIAHGHGEGHDRPGPKAGVSPQVTALLIACMAAALALSEQGAKHAEIKVQANLIAAADAWAQYQAKSTRATISKDLAALLQAVEPGNSPDVVARREQAIKVLNDDQDRFERDPKDGKVAISHRAEAFEHARDHALEQTHAYHNGSAFLELGIVLSTASAILGSRLLILVACGSGLIGALCAIAGVVRPEWGAF